MTINVNTYRVTVMSFPNNVVRGGLTSDESDEFDGYRLPVAFSNSE